MNGFSRRRILAMAGLFLVLQVVVVARGAHLALIEGEPLRVLAGRQHQHEVSLPPHRGVITDRNGKRLALSVQAASVYLRPRAFEAGDEAVAELARILQIDPAAVRAAVASEKKFVWLKRRTSRREWSAVENLQLRGVGTDQLRREFALDDRHQRRAVAAAADRGLGLAVADQSTRRAQRDEHAVEGRDAAEVRAVLALGRERHVQPGGLDALDPQALATFFNGSREGLSGSGAGACAMPSRTASCRTPRTAGCCRGLG